MNKINKSVQASTDIADPTRLSSWSPPSIPCKHSTDYQHPSPTSNYMYLRQQWHQHAQYQWQCPEGYTRGTGGRNSNWHQELQILQSKEIHYFVQDTLCSGYFSSRCGVDAWAAKNNQWWPNQETKKLWCHALSRTWLSYSTPNTTSDTDTIKDRNMGRSQRCMINRVLICSRMPAQYQSEQWVSYQKILPMSSGYCCSPWATL